MDQTVKPMGLSARADAFFGMSFRIMGIIFFARIIINIGIRTIYTFIPQISAGLGLTVASFGWLIFTEAVVGVAGPIFGIWSDRYGRRKLMIVGLISLAISVLGLTFSRQWWAILPMLFFGLAAAIFLPVQQAYISDQVAYHKRGRALATVEFSWALVGVFILPIVGWMIDQFGWRSPFIILSLLSLIGAMIMWRQLPSTIESHSLHTPVQLSWSHIKTILFQGNVLAAIGVGFLIFLATVCYLTVWGIWLTNDFGLGATMLGLVATGIGLAELGGSGLSSLFIDRIGKKRGSQVGLILLIIAFGLLPFTRSFLPVAIAGLIALALTAEFTIVSLLPIFSEQAPKARGTVLSLIFLGVGLGSSMGAPTATTLWEQYGLEAVCAVGIICALAALSITWKFLGETEVSPSLL